MDARMRAKAIVEIAAKNPAVLEMFALDMIENANSAAAEEERARILRIVDEEAGHYSKDPDDIPARQVAIVFANAVRSKVESV